MDTQSDELTKFPAEVASRLKIAISLIANVQRWEFIKENKKKKELDRESDQENKTTIKKKRKNFLFS